jgi:hypothetical protein
MIFDRYRFLGHLLAVAGLTLAGSAAPARADFLGNDVPRFFGQDFPHFFQDDIPCAFGGRPTSGTKTSCRGQSHSASHPPRHVTTRHPHAPAPAAAAAPDQGRQPATWETPPITNQ